MEWTYCLSIVLIRSRWLFYFIQLKTNLIVRDSQIHFLSVGFITWQSLLEFFYLIHCPNQISWQCTSKTYQIARWSGYNLKFRYSVNKSICLLVFWLFSLFETTQDNLFCFNYSHFFEMFTFFAYCWRIIRVNKRILF